MGMLIVIPFVSLSINYVFLDQGLANPWLYATAQIPICPGHEMSVFTAKKAPMGREIISPPTGSLYFRQ